MDELFGLPAHPLLVHIPVVLIPLAALGAVMIVARAAWRERYRWAVLVLAVVGAVGAILSASAGEELENRLRQAGERNTWHEHAEAGETAQNFAIVFAIAVALFVLGPWLWDRLLSARAGGDAASRPQIPKWLAVAVSVLLLGAATVSVVTIIDAGHSGADSVWEG